MSGAHGFLDYIPEEQLEEEEQQQQQTPTKKGESAGFLQYIDDDSAASVDSRSSSAHLTGLRRRKASLSGSGSPLPNSSPLLGRSRDGLDAWERQQLEKVLESTQELENVMLLINYYHTEEWPLFNRALIVVFHDAGKLDLLTHFWLKAEVQSTAHETGLFREDSARISGLQEYVWIHAREWLRKTVYSVVKRIAASPKRRKPEQFAMAILRVMQSSVLSFPLPVAKLLALLETVVKEKFPGASIVTLKLAVLFLRFVGPCIAAPQRTGLVEGELSTSGEVRRTLARVTKVLQEWCNGTIMEEDSLLDTTEDDESYSASSFSEASEAVPLEGPQTMLDMIATIEGRDLTQDERVEYSATEVREAKTTVAHYCKQYSELLEKLRSASDRTSVLEKHFGKLKVKMFGRSIAASDIHAVTTVAGPESLRADFSQGEMNARRYFEQFAQQSAEGKLSIGAERFLMLSSAVFTRDLSALLQDMSGDSYGAAQLYYLLSTDIGRRECKKFLRFSHWPRGNGGGGGSAIGTPKSKPKKENNSSSSLGSSKKKKKKKKKKAQHSPTQQRAANSSNVTWLTRGCSVFSYLSFLGWASCSVSKKSVLSVDARPDLFVLLNVAYSFQADEAMTSGKQRACNCDMLAGFLAGWWSCSLRSNVGGLEVQCQARGESSCQIILAPLNDLTSHLQRLRSEDSRYGAPRIGAKLAAVLAVNQNSESQRSVFLAQVRTSLRQDWAVASSSKAHSASTAINTTSRVRRIFSRSSPKKNRTVRRTTSSDMEGMSEAIADARAARKRSMEKPRWISVLRSMLELQQLKTDPSQALIEAYGGRHLLVKCSAWGVDCYATVQRKFASFDPTIKCPRCEEENKLGYARCKGCGMKAEIRGERNQRKASMVPATLFASNQVAAATIFLMGLAVGKAHAAQYEPFAQDWLPYKCQLLPVFMKFAGFGVLKLSKTSRLESSAPWVVAELQHSFEAEEHLDERRSDSPSSSVCMMSCGVLSGWFSHMYGHKFVAVELSCIGRGDGICKFVCCSAVEAYDRVRMVLAVMGKEALWDKLMFGLLNTLLDGPSQVDPRSLLARRKSLGH